MKRAWVWTLLVIVLSFLGLIGPLFKHSQIQQFSQIPILHDGRIKPMDSVARHVMLVLRGKQTVTYQKQTLTAAEWAYQVAYQPHRVDDYPIFRVDDPTVLGMMDIEPGQKRYFSPHDIAPYLPLIQEQYEAADQVPAQERNLFQKAITRFGNTILMYAQLRSTILPMAQKFSHYPMTWKVTLEWWFVQWQPFYYCMVINGMVFLGILGMWLWKRPHYLNIAYGAMLGSLIVHTLGILIRMLIVFRPPVTSLYTSALFVGWVAVIFGLLFERYLKQGFGTLMSALIGFLTLIVAHHLSLQGDTLEVMQAVLDSNFWLATHVVVVTMGYSATFFAGFLGYVYVIKGVFFPNFDRDQQKRLVTMVYGILCFSILFSFTGTILGGIWADQSWGRFWGWDPKENGALMIVLWVAAILHARWAGMIHDRGLIVMAILGNIVTSFSWFGVNMLGVGLHSYGFMEQMFVGLVAFVFIQLAFAWVGLLPLQYWKGLMSRE